MNPELLPAIAFIVAKASGHSRGNSVYDYAASKYVHFSGQVGDNVSVFDHSIGRHVTGRLPNLYHHLTGRHIQLRIAGNRFHGFDYDSGQHFNGTVRRNNVQIYDYGSGNYHQFQVM